MLNRARQDPSKGIPVLFPLASWARRKLALADWLIEELGKKYTVSHETSKQWIESGMLIALLDGLDEVAQEDRAACAKAIDSYREQYDLAPVVVCCRKTDYEILIQHAEKLKLTQAIVIAPLTSQHIWHFLQKSEELTALRQVYQQDQVLQELAQTPLMLTILAMTYHGKRREDVLLTGALEDQQRQVFAAYVQRMFQRRSRYVQYSQAKTIFWLSWLAKQLQSFNLTELDITAINTDWLPKDLRLVYNIIWPFIQALVRQSPYLLFLLIAFFIASTSGQWSSFWEMAHIIIIMVIVVFFVFIGIHYEQRENARQDRKSEENQKVRAESWQDAMSMATAQASTGNYAIAGAYLTEGYSYQSDGYTFIINWLLQSRGVIPPNYKHFLDSATERIFLRKVGDRYIFIHRRLLEYFASLEYGGDTLSSMTEGKK